MDCKAAQESLGALLDGEVSDQERAWLDQHLDACPSCTAELAQLRAMMDRLQSCDRESETKAPPDLWSSIERELDRSSGKPGRPHHLFQIFRKPIAAAASLAIVVGLGALVGVWITSGVPAASAETVNYAMLLDGVADNVDASFKRFLDYYHAQPIDAKAARDAAPGLSFSLPAELPGKHRLDRVYRLRFGRSPGIAAYYRGEDGPLIVFFHPPVKKGVLGVHKEMPCHVGKQWGHRVDIGPWKLVHFTDPTTCHCLLSTLDLESEVPAVFAAVAPKFTDGEGGHGH